MAKSIKKTSRSEPATTAMVPARIAALPQSGAITPSTRRVLQAAQALNEQTGIDDIRSAAMLFKAIVGEQRENQLSLRTLAQYDQFAQAVRLLLDQPRDERVQPLVEAFADVLGPIHAQALLDVHNVGIHAIQTIAAEPVHTQAYEPEVIEITEEPPFLAKLLGARTKTTRITR